MSILQPISDLAVRQTPVSGPESANANDAVLRATGVVSLLAIGAIHFLQIVPTTESTPLLGVSFLFLIAACLAVAARLATRSDQRTWMASAVVCAAAIGGLRLHPHLQHPVGQPGCRQLVVHARPGRLVRRDHPAGVQCLRRPHPQSPPNGGHTGPGQPSSPPAWFRAIRARHEGPRQQHNAHRRLSGQRTLGQADMTNWYQHRSNPAKPGRRRDPVRPAPAPPAAMARLAGGRRVCW